MLESMQFIWKVHLQEHIIQFYWDSSNIFGAVRIYFVSCLLSV